MGKKQLHKDIRSHGGYILSDGTLNLLHLLTKAGDFIAGYNLAHKNKSVKALYLDIVGCFKQVAQINEQDIISRLKKYHTTFRHHQYHGNIELKTYDEQEWHPNLIWEDFETLMEQIAPKGYYFGYSEGDGACIGFFKYED